MGQDEEATLSLVLPTETGHSRGHNERPLAHPAKLCLAVLEA